MNHKINAKKLNRSTSHRLALLRNLSAQLITHERITTTLPKAKALRPYVEKLISLAKRGGSDAEKLTAIRVAASKLNNDRVVTQKLFGELRERYASRNGGYTRILKINNRIGDNTPMALIELVDRKVAQVAAAPAAAETAEK